MTNHGESVTSLPAIVKSFWNNRQLIRQMTEREVVGRYRGSFMGLAWSFFHPVLMLSVYTFVFSVVFKVRWGIEGEESKAGFAIALFVGMIIHGLFAECVNRAPALILSNGNYVKKVVFPLEILPMVVMISTLFQTVVSIAVLLTAVVIVRGFLYWTILLLPMVMLPLVFVTLGVSWFLASFGVFARDIAQVTGITTTVMMFLSPVFYPVSALPRAYQPLLMANPLTFIIEQTRDVLLVGHLPDWRGLVVYSMISIFIAWSGFWWFQKTRKGFADVL
ncbi:MAG: ABC transporter permease [Syntrophorhabdaceae bacterium]